MDALRRALALSIAVIAVLCVVPASWDDADAAGRLDGLMLYEISPDNPEGISLYNYGNEPVDLRDYMVADQPSVSGGREGSLHFTQEIIVQPGTYVVLADADPETSMFTKGEDVYLTSSGNDFGIETEGSFNMANGGDDIYLLSKDGTVLDALFYGDKEVDGSQYWTGEPVEIPSDGYIQRTGGTDTDSASDWSVPGTLGLEFDPDLRYGAEVTPFLFPDHGGIPVYDTLESARVSIDIEIYMITSANLYALLIEKEHQGVEVRLLLEGNNINDNLGPYLPYIQQLVEAGGEVRMIGVGSDGVADRFNLVHAKYAVVDGGTVIVTSENWTEDNLNGHLDDDPYDSTSGDGNRGWGAVVDSDGYAGFMSSVFENDWSMDYGDVKTFDELYGKADLALYAAKHKGKDACAVYRDVLPEHTGRPGGQGKREGAKREKIAEQRPGHTAAFVKTQAPCCLCDAGVPCHDAKADHKRDKAARDEKAKAKTGHGQQDLWQDSHEKPPFLYRSGRSVR